MVLCSLLNVFLPSKLHQINFKVTSDTNALASTGVDILAYMMASFPDLAKNASYDISELIMRCTFNGAKCSYK